MSRFCLIFEKPLKKNKDYAEPFLWLRNHLPRWEQEGRLAYTKLKQIGEGGFAIVNAAIHNKTQTPVAVKSFFVNDAAEVAQLQIRASLFF